MLSRSLRAVLAIVFISGVSGGTYLVSQKLSNSNSISPNAPSSKPFAKEAVVGGTTSKPVVVAKTTTTPFKTPSTNTGSSKASDDVAIPVVPKVTAINTPFKTPAVSTGNTSSAPVTTTTPPKTITASPTPYGYVPPVVTTTKSPTPLPTPFGYIPTITAVKTPTATISKSPSVPQPNPAPPTPIITAPFKTPASSTGNTPSISPVLTPPPVIAADTFGHIATEAEKKSGPSYMSNANNDCSDGLGFISGTGCFNKVRKVLAIQSTVAAYNQHVQTVQSSLASMSNEEIFKQANIKCDPNTQNCFETLRLAQEKILAQNVIVNASDKNLITQVRLQSQAEKDFNNPALSDKYLANTYGTNPSAKPDVVLKTLGFNPTEIQKITISRDQSVAQKKAIDNQSTYTDLYLSGKSKTELANIYCQNSLEKSFCLKDFETTDLIAAYDKNSPEYKQIITIKKDNLAASNYVNPNLSTAALAKIYCEDKYQNSYMGLSCKTTFSREMYLSEISDPELKQNSILNRQAYLTNLIPQVVGSGTPTTNLDVSTKKEIIKLNEDTAHAFWVYLKQNEDRKLRLGVTTDQLAKEFNAKLAADPTLLNKNIAIFNGSPKTYDNPLANFNFAKEENPLIIVQYKDIIKTSTIAGLANNGVIETNWTKVSDTYKDEARKLACESDPSLKSLCNQALNPPAFRSGMSEQENINYQNKIKNSLALLDNSIKNKDVYLQQIFDTQTGAANPLSTGVSNIADINNFAVDQNLVTKSKSEAELNLNLKDNLFNPKYGFGNMSGTSISIPSSATNLLSEKKTYTQDQINAAANEYLNRRLVEETYARGTGIIGGVATASLASAACSGLGFGALICGVTAGTAAAISNYVPILGEKTAAEIEAERQYWVKLTGNETVGSFVQSSFASQGAACDTVDGIKIGASCTTKNNQFALLNEIQSQGLTVGSLSDAEIRANISLQPFLNQQFDALQNENQTQAYINLAVAPVMGAISYGVGANIANVTTTNIFSNFALNTAASVGNSLLGGAQAVYQFNSTVDFVDTQSEIILTQCQRQYGINASQCNDFATTVNQENTEAASNNLIMAVISDQIIDKTLMVGGFISQSTSNLLTGTNASNAPRVDTINPNDSTILSPELSNLFNLSDPRILNGNLGDTDTITLNNLIKDQTLHNEGNNNGSGNNLTIENFADLANSSKVPTSETSIVQAAVIYRDLSDVDFRTKLKQQGFSNADLEIALKIRESGSDRVLMNQLEERRLVNQDIYDELFLDKNDTTQNKQTKLNEEVFTDEGNYFKKESEKLVAEAKKSIEASKPKESPVALLEKHTNISKEKLANLTEDQIRDLSGLLEIVNDNTKTESERKAFSVILESQINRYLDNTTNLGNANTHHLDEYISGSLSEITKLPTDYLDLLNDIEISLLKPSIDEYNNPNTPESQKKIIASKITKLVGELNSSSGTKIIPETANKKYYDVKEGKYTNDPTDHTIAISPNQIDEFGNVYTDEYHIDTVESLTKLRKSIIAQNDNFSNVIFQTEDLALMVDLKVLTLAEAQAYPRGANLTEENIPGLIEQKKQAQLNKIAPPDPNSPEPKTPQVIDNNSPLAEISAITDGKTAAEILGIPQEQLTAFDTTINANQRQTLFESIIRFNDESIKFDSINSDGQVTFVKKNSNNSTTEFKADPNLPDTKIIAEAHAKGIDIEGKSVKEIQSKLAALGENIDLLADNQLVSKHKEIAEILPNSTPEEVALLLKTKKGQQTLDHIADETYTLKDNQITKDTYILKDNLLTKITRLFDNSLEAQIIKQAKSQNISVDGKSLAQLTQDIRVQNNLITTKTDLALDLALKQMGTKLLPDRLKRAIVEFIRENPNADISNIQLNDVRFWSARYLEDGYPGWDAISKAIDANDSLNTTQKTYLKQQIKEEMITRMKSSFTANNQDLVLSPKSANQDTFIDLNSDRADSIGQVASFVDEKFVGVMNDIIGDINSKLALGGDINGVNFPRVADLNLPTSGRPGDYILLGVSLDPEKPTIFHIVDKEIFSSVQSPKGEILNSVFASELYKELPDFTKSSKEYLPIIEQAAKNSPDSTTIPFGKKGIDITGHVLSRSDIEIIIDKPLAEFKPKPKTPFKMSNEEINTLSQYTHESVTSFEGLMASLSTEDQARVGNELVNLNVKGVTNIDINNTTQAAGDLAGFSTTTTAIADKARSSSPELADSYLKGWSVIEHTMQSDLTTVLKNGGGLKTHEHAGDGIRAIGTKDVSVTKIKELVDVSTRYKEILTDASNGKYGYDAKLTADFLLAELGDDIFLKIGIGKGDTLITLHPGEYSISTEVKSSVNIDQYLDNVKKLKIQLKAEGKADIGPIIGIDENIYTRFNNNAGKAELARSGLELYVDQVAGHEAFFIKKSSPISTTATQTKTSPLKTFLRKLIPSESGGQGGLRINLGGEKIPNSAKVNKILGGLLYVTTDTTTTKPNTISQNTLTDSEIINTSMLKNYPKATTPSNTTDAPLTNPIKKALVSPIDTLIKNSPSTPRDAKTFITTLGGATILNGVIRAVWDNYFQPEPDQNKVSIWDIPTFKNDIRKNLDYLLFLTFNKTNDPYNTSYLSEGSIGSKALPTPTILPITINPNLKTLPKSTSDNGQPELLSNTRTIYAVVKTCQDNFLTQNPTQKIDGDKMQTCFCDQMANKCNDPRESQLGESLKNAFNGPTNGFANNDALKLFESILESGITTSNSNTNLNGVQTYTSSNNKDVYVKCPVEKAMETRFLPGDIIVDNQNNYFVCTDPQLTPDPTDQSKYLQSCDTIGSDSTTHLLAKKTIKGTPENISVIYRSNNYPDDICWKQ